MQGFSFDNPVQTLNNNFINQQVAPKVNNNKILAY